MNSCCRLILIVATLNCLRSRECAAEPPVVQVRFYSSVTAGESDSHVNAFTKPLVDYVQARIARSIDLGVVHGETDQDLLQFGESLTADNDDIHVGIVWGLEYGWLKKRFPRLESMVVTAQGLGSEGRSSWPTQILVAEGFGGNSLKDLQGGVLATYRHFPLMNQLYVHGLLKENGTDVRRFFEEVQEYDTVPEAVLAVHSGDATCVVLDANCYIRHIASRPRIKLKALMSSEPFPEPTLIGIPEKVDNLVGTGKWRQVQSVLLTAHADQESRDAMMFWKIDSFVLPGAQDFEKYVRQRVLDYPLSTVREIQKAWPQADH